MSAWAWSSLACLLWAAGAALWGYAKHVQDTRTMAQRLHEAIDVELSVAAQPAQQALDTVVEKHHERWLQLLPVWVRQALSTQQWTLLGLGTLTLTLIGVWLTDLWIAPLIPVCVFLVLLFFAWMRWQKLRQRMVQQLPAFIDVMVRMVVLGHTAQSAFLLAAPTVKAPLSEPVLQSSAFVRAGMTVEQALLLAGKDLQLQELNLLASVLRVSERFGGRVDRLLERVASLIRDREQAEQEMKAMSAEVRISAWILSLLPVLVGGAIIMLNAAYFLQMWDDPSGRWVALTGFGVQLLGTLLLYRLAQLSDS